MESLNEQEAMRVLQAAAALDALRAPGGRPTALPPPRAPVPSQLPQQQQQQQQQQQGPSSSEISSSQSQSLAEDIWREMAETESGEQKRHGDLDTWLDVFRATAGSVLSAWRSREALTFELLAFGWLALARKHELLTCAPPAAAGEEVNDTSLLAGWLSAAQWVQALHHLQAAPAAAAAAGDGGGDAPEQRLVQQLGLQPADLLGYRSEPSGSRPAFFIAVHHDSRTIRLVIRGASSLPDMLNTAAAGASAIDVGFAHKGSLAAAQQLLAEEAGLLRAAVEAHPGYSLHCMGHSEGAGIAALVAVLVLAQDGSRASELVGSPAGGVRATCFAPPPVLTSELSDRHAACIESIVYNADLWSRCSAASLRRLTSEMSAASEEVLARSELAQALRRSGALGLANHVVAAALCRYQSPQESPTGALGPAPALVGGPSRAVLAESLGALARPPPPSATAPSLAAQTNGRAGHLATLATSLKMGPGPAASLEPIVVCKPSGGTAGAAPMPVPPALPLPPPASPPVPSGLPSGPLPPLASMASLAGGAAVSGAATAARGNGVDSPLRRRVEQQASVSVGVLSPPPLVAAAAAAAAASVHSHQAATAAAAVTAAGPTPPRRGLRSFPIEPKESRSATTGAFTVATPVFSIGNVVAVYSEDGSGGGAGGATSIVVPPLQVPPLLLPASGGASPAAVPSAALSIPRLETLAPGEATAGSPAAVQTAAPLPSPPALPALPPLLAPVHLPLGMGPGTAAQPQSPRLARQVTLLEPQEGLPPQSLSQSQSQQPELLPERSLRNLSLLQLPDGPSHKQLQAPLPLQQLQLQQLRTGQEADRASPDDAQELLIPGLVYLIERRGANATASFRLLRDLNRAHINRILLKRSMLRDHLLGHYVTALERIIQH